MHSLWVRDIHSALACVQSAASSMATSKCSAHVAQVVGWAWQGMETHSSAGAGMFSMSLAVVLLSFEAGAELPFAAAWLPFARVPPLAAAWGALKSFTAMYSSRILHAILAFWLQQRTQAFSQETTSFGSEVSAEICSLRPNGAYLASSRGTFWP